MTSDDDPSRSIAARDAPDGRIARPAIGVVQRGDWGAQLYLYPTGLVFPERLVVEVVDAITGAPLEKQDRVRLRRAGLSRLLRGHPEQFSFYLGGRILVAVLGTLAVIPAFLAGRGLGGTVAGMGSL